VIEEFIFCKERVICPSPSLQHNLNPAVHFKIGAFGAGKTQSIEFKAAPEAALPGYAGGGGPGGACDGGGGIAGG